MELEIIAARMAKFVEARNAGRLSRDESVAILLEIDAALFSNGFEWSDIAVNNFSKTVENYKTGKVSA